MFAQLLAFLAIAALVIVTPGPDTALTIKSTLLGGRRAGVLTALGVASGQAVWTIATAAGIAALLVESAALFRTVQLVGAAYLVYLGLQALRGAIRPARASAETTARSISARLPYRQGLISNLANPKMAVFFTSLLPQFGPGEPTFWSLLALGLVFCLLTLTWLTGYALLVARTSGLMRNTALGRMIEGMTGTVLVGLGLRIAAEHR